MELSEVRQGIDQVDKQIKELFIKRMQLADMVARIKAETSDDIYKPEREEAIIKKNTEGIDERIEKEYTALIKRIMEVSRKYQYGKTLELRDCFPFSFETTLPDIKNIVMLKSQLYLCHGFSRDIVSVVDSFDEMGELISSGRADAGMGIIEEIGVSSDNQLSLMLMKNKLYINSCVIITEKGRRMKLVTFSKKLVVMQEHNRLQLMFECPNRSGSVGSVLCQIADYGVNLTEIHSRPNGKTENWNYEFYVELSMNLLDKESQALIYQLSKETEYLQLLGSFKV